MFTHNTKYPDVVIAFPFGQRTSFLNECEESRIVCGAVPARDPSALRFVGMTRDRLGKLLYYLQKRSRAGVMR